MTTQPDEPVTDVIFRRWPVSDGGDVIALFPTLPAGSGFCTSYQHIGQHSAADYGHCIRVTAPAEESEPDVQALKRELEGIGYRLRVLQRAPPWRVLRGLRND